MITKKEKQTQRLHKLLKKLGIKKIKASDLYAKDSKVVYY